jgi:hypothetical protein
MLSGKVSKLSITFTLYIFPDSSPFSVSRVLRDCHQSKTESELTFCCPHGLFGLFSLFDGWNVDLFLPCFWQMDDYPYATLGANGWFCCDGLHRPSFRTLLWDMLHHFGYTGILAYRGRSYRQFGLRRCKVHVNIPTHPTDPTMMAWFLWRVITLRLVCPYWCWFDDYFSLLLSMGIYSIYL